MVKKKFQKTFENLLTSPTKYVIIKSTSEGKHLKNQKGIDTMEKNKMTYAQAISTVLNDEAISLTDEVRGKLEQLLASVSKTHKKGDTQTAQQVENAQMIEQIFQQMESNRAYSIAELIKELPVVAEYNQKHENEMSSQRMANLMKALVDGGRITKTTEKRKVYYTKAE